MGENKKIFFPNLDGLRFFAFFAVFLSHSFYSKFDYINQTAIYTNVRAIMHAGIFGVNFFFVLSGFLITYLLLDEKTKKGTVNVLSFYMRRVLRIWPLYYLIVFIGFVVIPETQHLLGNKDYVETGDLLSYLCFYSNYSDQPATTAVLGVLWSIAVEEQFYLIWPLFLLVTPLSRVGYLCLGLVIVSMLIRCIYLGDNHDSHLFSCLSDFAVGGGLAYASFYKASWIEKIKSMKMGWIILIYVLGALMFLFRSIWADVYLLYMNQRLLFSIFFAFVILEQNSFDNSFYKWKFSKLLSDLGRHTYGLYLYHFVAIYIVSIILGKLLFNTQSYQVFFVEPILSLILSIIVSYLSYRYFEKPFLKLKDRFAYSKK